MWTFATKHHEPMQEKERGCRCVKVCQDSLTESHLLIQPCTRNAKFVLQISFDFVQHITGSTPQKNRASASDHYESLITLYQKKHIAFEIWLGLSDVVSVHFRFILPKCNWGKRRLLDPARHAILWAGQSSIWGDCQRGLLKWRLTVEGKHWFWSTYKLQADISHTVYTASLSLYKY